MRDGTTPDRQPNLLNLDHPAVGMRLYYRMCRQITQALCVWTCSERVYGTDRVPQGGGVVLACNHQSFLDPMLATLALPRECHYMARDTLFANPVFRRIIESVNAFPVKRGASDVAAIKTAIGRLATGALITTFPEGTRTADGRVGPCQPGVILLARRARVPLVPTAIEGAYDIWPRHRRWPTLGCVQVEYGEPWWPQEMDRFSRDEMSRRLTACIRSIHNRLRRRAGKEPFAYE